jgi:hypothetical protein
MGSTKREDRVIVWIGAEKTDPLYPKIQNDSPLPVDKSRFTRKTYTYASLLL